MTRAESSRAPARHRSRYNSSRHTTVLLLAFAAACLLALAAARGASGQPGEGAVDEDPGGDPYAAGELIVTYKEDIQDTPVRSLASSVESTVEKSIPAIDSQLFDFPDIKQESSQEERERLLEEKKQELERDPSVESVDYNYIKQLDAAPNDPRFDEQWHLKRVAAPVAWDETTGTGATIAVVDTGIDRDHPDLVGKIDRTCDATNANEDNQMDPEACEEGVNANDTDGHGTHVAGIAAAATNNGLGVAGTCPDCRLIAAKAENDDGVITLFAVNAAVVWAADRGADVINMSYSGSPAADSEREALEFAHGAGAVLVASAGNDDQKRPVYPAGYDNVISVAATTKKDERASYSNFGPTIDLSAPGGSGGKSTSILSTVPENYGYKNGTSMSAPIVSGVAGLLSSQGLSNEEIRARIESTATDLGPRGRDNRFGHGRIDAAAAVGARPRNTLPKVSKLHPKRGAKIRGKRVRIGATVRDDQTDLKKRDIKLLIDGRRVGFRYDRANDRLSRSIRLAPGRHVVRISVRDGWGGSSVARWSFRTTRAARSAGRSERRTSPPREAPGQSVSQNVTITR
ncbi:MAG: S8 family serine peptidase [Rubrobacteraceae bacterium]